MSARVLHLIPSLTGGGAERQLAYLLAAQVEHGADAHIGYVTPGPNLSIVGEAEDHLHRMPDSGNHSPTRYRNIAKLVDHLRPRIVQTWLPQMDILGGIACTLRRLPWILSERSAGGCYPPSLKNSIRKALGKRAAAVVANSSAGIEYWGREGDRGLRETISNLVPYDRIRRVAESDSQHNGRLLLFAGRFAPEKNVLVVLDAFLDVLRRREDVEAVMFGEGPLGAALREKAAGSDCSERIRIEPYTDRLWQWMHSASAFISLSLFEGLPNAVLEAAAIGCPLVLSDIVGHRDIVDPESAILLAELDAESAACALLNIIDEPRTARARADRANDRVREMSVDRTAARYDKLYEKILAGQYR